MLSVAKHLSVASAILRCAQHDRVDFDGKCSLGTRGGALQMWWPCACPHPYEAGARQINSTSLPSGSSTYIVRLAITGCTPGRGV